MCSFLEPQSVFFYFKNSGKFKSQCDCLWVHYYLQMTTICDGDCVYVI